MKKINYYNFEGLKEITSLGCKGVRDRAVFQFSKYLTF